MNAKEILQDILDNQIKIRNQHITNNDYIETLEDIIKSMGDNKKYKFKVGDVVNPKHYVDEMGGHYTVLDVNSDGNIKLSRCCDEYFNGLNYVLVEIETLAVRFDNVYQSGTHEFANKLFELFASMANVHYLRIFDQFVKENHPMSVGFTLEKLREAIKKG